MTDDRLTMDEIKAAIVGLQRDLDKGDTPYGIRYDHDLATVLATARHWVAQQERPAGPDTMTDERSNEEIVDEAWKVWNADLSDRRLVSEVIVAALAAAGRLVTPEHDAQVLRDAAAALDDEDPIETALHGVGYPLGFFYDRADAIEKGATS